MGVKSTKKTGGILICSVGEKCLLTSASDPMYVYAYLYCDHIILPEMHNP